ncbi:MAG: ADP-ribosylation factor-like protein [candidate division KSB1 bacterium]|nr:ADP-ribosylation factor-like protein [candidate division KSB1 bacterium]MDZ7386151.1 ADP-ribosylation factor-like protein [candidate division KSB1 bacterium]
MFINAARQEIIFKIVYYGPGLGGKTANLLYIYEHIDPRLRGELISLRTREQRTLFFDFLRLEVGRIKQLRPRFNVYTTPGQVYYHASRRIVLEGVDGIVFVADSQRERLNENLASMAELEEYLIDRGSTLEEFPWVIQYNKRDLPDVLPVSMLQETLNFCRVPYFEAVAVQGVGVFESLRACINRVVAYVQAGERRSVTHAANQP